MEINIDVDIDTHEKYHRLSTELKDSARAEGFITRLFRWTAQHHSDGDLSGVTTAELELFLHWNGKPGRLVAALLRSGWLDPDEGVALPALDAPLEAVKARWVHGFKRRNGHVEASRVRATNAAHARWRKLKGDKDSAMHDASKTPPLYVRDVLNVPREAVRTCGSDAPPAAQGGGGAPPEKTTPTLERCPECKGMVTPWSWKCPSEGCGAKACNERGKTCKRDHMNRCLPVSPIVAGAVRPIPEEVVPVNGNGVH